MLISGALYGNMIAFGMIMCPITKAPKLCVTPTPSNKYDQEVILDLNQNEISKEPEDFKEPPVIQRNTSFQMMRAFLKNPLARRKSSLAAMTNTDVEVLSQLNQRNAADWEDTIAEENESLVCIFIHN